MCLLCMITRLKWTVSDSIDWFVLIKKVYSNNVKLGLTNTKKLLCASELEYVKNSFYSSLHFSLWKIEDVLVVREWCFLWSKCRSDMIMPLIDLSEIFSRKLIERVKKIVFNQWNCEIALPDAPLKKLARVREIINLETKLLLRTTYKNLESIR